MPSDKDDVVRSISFGPQRTKGKSSMHIHNLLAGAHRARAVDALEAVATHLPKCQPSESHFDDELLFDLESAETGLESLRLRMTNRELRIFVAVSHGGRLQRTSFVEHLCKDDPTNPRTMAQVVSRLSDWRRYVDDVPTDDALRAIEEKRSIAIQAAIGAISMRDERWKTLWIHPGFDTKPPVILLGERSGRISVVRVSGAKGESSGRMSDELVRELSSMSDRMFVTTSRPISNPGIQVEFGPPPEIRVVNDLSPMDMLNSMRRAEALGLQVLP